MSKWNKGSVVYESEMGGTAGNKNGCGYGPDVNNSTLNSGKHRGTETEKPHKGICVKKYELPFLTTFQATKQRPKILKKMQTATNYSIGPHGNNRWTLGLSVMTVCDRSV